MWLSCNILTDILRFGLTHFPFNLDIQYNSINNNKKTQNNTESANKM